MITEKSFTCFCLIVSLCFLHGTQCKLLRFDWPAQNAADGSSESNSNSGDGDSSYIRTYFFRQKLDHFNKSNNATWENRYYVSDKYYVPGGPVFLYQSGEVPASMQNMQNYTWMDLYAKTFGALCIQIEHRYFGQSQPTSDASTEHLKYLTIEQVVADTAHFVRKARKLFNYQPKWLIFGGSYSGALAVWIREKHPDLLHGAISSSGPVNPVLDFTAYYDIVSKDYALNSTKCKEGIQEGFASLQKILTSESELNYANRIFNLCPKLSINNTADVQRFVFRLAAEFGSMAQYSDDGYPPDPLNISVICQVMANESLGSGIIRVAITNDLFFGTNFPYCFNEMSYNAFMQELSQTAWDAYAVEHGDRQWLYLLCNQFASFETSDGQSNIFGSSFPLSMFIKRCIDVFGPKFNLEYITKNVAALITTYGGYHPNTTNVLSVQGSLDPWQALGICNNDTAGVTAIYIEGTAHCADEYPPSPYDPPQLREARWEIIEYIRGLLTPPTLAPVNPATVITPNFNDLP